MKKVPMLIQIEHSKRKLAWKFFFACLKPWSSKNSAISAADRNSWKFQARHFFPEGIYKTSPAVATFKDTQAKGKRSKRCSTLQMLLRKSVCVQNFTWECFSY